MSFREKVKGILEAKTVTMSHPKSQKAGTQGKGGAIKVSKSEVKKYLNKGWVRTKPLPKDYVDPDDPVKVDGRTHMTQHEIKRKSKRSATNEEWLPPLPPPPSHAQMAAYNRKAKRAKTLKDAKAADVNPKLLKQRKDPVKDKARTDAIADTGFPQNKSQSTNENSNHPFYQKVKALSRNKKNNSLLERKSKTIKLLIGRINPEEKSKKMEEGPDSEEFKKLYRRHVQKKKSKETEERSPKTKPGQSIDHSHGGSDELDPSEWGGDSTDPEFVKKQVKREMDAWRKHQKKKKR